MAQTVHRVTRAGTYLLAGRSSGDTGIPLVQIVPDDDFAGSVVLYKDTAAPGAAQNLVAVTSRLRGSADPVIDYAAGVSFGAETAVEPDTGGLPLYAVVTVASVPTPNTGAVTITTLQNVTPTPDDDTVPLRGVDLTNIPLNYPEDLAFQLALARDAA